VILEDGTVEFGRPVYWDGAHAKGYNDTHLGICLIGRGESEFTNEQLNSLRELVRGLKDRYKLEKEKIIGHYEVNRFKSCPNMDMVKFRDSL